MREKKPMPAGTEEIERWNAEAMREALKKIEEIANQPTRPLPEGDSMESRLHRIWMLAKF